MEKTYAPHDIEQRNYQNWEAKGYLALNARSNIKIISKPESL
jgi:valyl-tRNA synthetase